MTVQTQESLETNIQTAKKSYEWTLTASNVRGTLHLSWSDSTPFIAQGDLIVVYDGGFPKDDPLDGVKVSIQALPGEKTWDTGLPYGPNWHCARIADKLNLPVIPKLEPKAFIVKLVTEDC